MITWTNKNFKLKYFRVDIKMDIKLKNKIIFEVFDSANKSYTISEYIFNSILYFLITKGSCIFLNNP